MAIATQSTYDQRELRRYMLRMTDINGKPFPLPAELSKLAPNSEFEFPLSPQSLEYTDRARTGLHPYADGTTGADEQGATVPSVQMSGTFGEGIRGNSLGVRLDGRQWQRALEMFIGFYLETQHKAARYRTPPAVLEWHDTYKKAHLIVTPQATPRGREDAGSPYKESFQLVLTGLRRTTEPPKAQTAQAADPVLMHNTCPFVYQCRADGIPREEGCPFAFTRTEI